MKVFGTTVAAIVHILEYCPSTDFLYKEINQITQKDLRISFSILMDLKYKSAPSAGTIGVDLMYIKDHPSEVGDANSQRISYIQLWSRSIKEVHADIENNESSSFDFTLQNDPWNFKHTVMLNFESVPVLSPGPYAIALYAIEEDQAPRRKLLDCAYFQVK